MPKFKKQFSVAEMPDELQSNTQLAFEAGKWQAKYETIKEVLDYERKKRKEVETNLNKLAYELGGVKNEVRQLESKIRLLTGQSAKKEEPVEKKEEIHAAMPEFQHQPAAQSVDELFSVEPEKPKKSAPEPPRLYVKFADVKNLETFEQPEPEQPEPEPEPFVPAPPRAEIKIPVIPVKEEPAKKEDDNIMVALQTNFKSEAAEAWGLATSLLDTLKRWPQELYEEAVRSQETQQGTYHEFFKRFQKLHADYSHYRHLMPIIDDDLKNLDKIIPHVDQKFAELQEA